VAAQPQVNPEKEFRLGDAECRLLVARILASREFQRAIRLRAFLTYVVEKKIVGAPEEVTESLIGHRVFGRPAAYSPGEDSIVRTEARTLRQRLERYFAGEGAGEPVVLEIPRGGYLPVFRLRSESSVATPGEEPAAVAPHRGLSRRQWIGLGATAALSGVGLRAWRGIPPYADSSPGLVPSSGIRLESSDPRLTLAFQRARERALACVFTGDPVGEWYASNRDNRAFCMRDTAHENIGAALLGLYPHSRNMLRRFAASIARTRNWCGYWIITKDGFPSPFDYTSDDNFSYALPANFDILRACWHQLLWTGDRQYLDSVFTTFYECTVSRYVAEWDSNRDGIMEGRPDRPRVSASFNQQPPLFRTGADLIAAQYAAYLAYAAIQEIKGGPGSLSREIAREYRAKAEALRARFNSEWWDPARNCFRTGVLPDGSWSFDYVAPCNVYPLKFGIPEDGPKAEASLDIMERNRPPFDSTYSYYPEVLYRYERNESGYQHLLKITDPQFSGYAMAETAYAAIGSIGTGLMGIHPDAPRSLVQTRPRLTKDVAWVRLLDVPVGVNRISIEHRGLAETHFTNHAGETLTWKATFPVPDSSNTANILIDGGAAPKLTFENLPNRQPTLTATVSVKPRQTCNAKLII
jgi:hypothetical protein